MKVAPPTTHFEDGAVTLILGNALDALCELPSGSVDMIYTSPPYYGLRDYKQPGQLGLERTLTSYTRQLVRLFREARRVLRNDGTFWLNLGDAYAGRANAGRMYEANREYNGRRGLHNPGVMPGRKNTTGDAPFKNLLLVPAKTAIALQRDGWILRNDIIWKKPNAKPESAKDRFMSTYEHLFMFSKRPKYYFDLDAVRAHRAPKRDLTLFDDEGPWRLPNPGDVWEVPITPFPGAHFATQPIDLATRAILAGSRSGGIVLDPFSGSGTTGAAALQVWPARRYIGIDINEEYLNLSLRTRFLLTPLAEGADNDFPNT